MSQTQTIIISLLPLGKTEDSYRMTMMIHSVKVLTFCLKITHHIMADFFYETLQKKDIERCIFIV